MTTTNDIDWVRPFVQRYPTSTNEYQTDLALRIAEASPALLARVDELTADLDRLTREHVEVNTTVINAWEALNRAGFQSPVDGVAELIDKLSAALTQSRQQAATYANEIGALKADLERTRAELATADIVIASMRAAIDEDEAVAR